MSQIDKCFKYFTSQPDRGPEPRWSVVEERHQPVHRSDQVSISKTYSWRWWWCYVLATRWPTTTDSQGGVRLDLRKWKDRLKSSTPAGQLWEPPGWPSWQSRPLWSNILASLCQLWKPRGWRPWPRPLLEPKTITIITIHLFGHHGHHHKLNLIVSSGHVCNMFLSL